MSGVDHGRPGVERSGSRGTGRLMAVVARRDYVRTVKRRGFVVGTLLLPIGIGALVALSVLLGPAAGAGGGGGGSDARVVVVNESGLDLEANAAALPGVQLVTREEGIAAITAGDVDEVYVVPNTYPADPTIRRISGEEDGGLFGGLQRQSAQAQQLSLLLVTSLLAEAGVPPETASQVVTPIDVQAETVSGEPVTGGPSLARFLVPFGFTMIFVMSIFITSGYLLQSVTEEKENRVVEIVLSSVPALPLMAGKILGLGAAGLTQVAVWVISAVAAFAVVGRQVPDLGELPLSPVAILLGLIYFALGYLAYGAIFTAIGAVAPGNREAQQYSGFFGFVAVIPLIFTSLFLSDLGSPIVAALALVPVTAPAAMLLVVSLSAEPPWPLVLASLASLTVFTLVATVASACVFRATLLLYGVQPSIRRIVSAVFARA